MFNGILNDGGYMTRKAEWTTHLLNIICEWEVCVCDCVCVCSGPHPQNMEVPSLGGELQL